MEQRLKVVDLVKQPKITPNRFGNLRWRFQLMNPNWQLGLAIEEVKRMGYKVILNEEGNNNEYVGVLVLAKIILQSL